VFKSLWSISSTRQHHQKITLLNNIWGKKVNLARKEEVGIKIKYYGHWQRYIFECSNARLVKRSVDRSERTWTVSPTTTTTYIISCVCVCAQHPPRRLSRRSFGGVDARDVPRFYFYNIIPQRDACWPSCPATSRIAVKIAATHTHTHT